MISAALSLPCLTESLKSCDLPIFLYGMGNGAEKIYAYLNSHGISIKGVVASDEFVRGQSFLGYNVEKISQAEQKYGRLCLVVCFGLEGEKCRFLYELAKKHKIISPNLPVFGQGVCNKEYISQHIEDFEKVYSLLADDLSKQIFLQLIKYNITGEINYLLGNNGLTAPDEFYNHNKRHIDVGAYDGDTATEYAQNSSAYADIIAFEPDSITYKKLIKNTEHLRNVVAENAAVGQRNGFVAFDVGNGRASHCGEGEGSVKCVCIDNYCGYPHINANGTPVGSIKIDAEGMDTEVIYGAVNTIYVCKSHISVALYHRAGDYISIPLLLRKHNNKYRFYLRKKEYIPAWDVFLYAINS